MYNQAALEVKKRFRFTRRGKILFNPITGGFDEVHDQLERTTTGFAGLIREGSDANTRGFWAVEGARQF